MSFSQVAPFSSAFQLMRLRCADGSHARQKVVKLILKAQFYEKISPDVNPDDEMPIHLSRIDAGHFKTADAE